MNKQDLLFEIGCEDLPAKGLSRLAEALAEQILAGLTQHKLEHGEHTVFATPRRLAVWIKGINCKQPPKKLERHGPFVKDAFDREGVPTLACLGFANSCGVSTDRLEKQDTPKGERLFVSIEKPGDDTKSLLPSLIQQAVTKLPIPRPMRWANHDFSFVRPVRWLVLLFGHDAVPVSLLGQASDRYTYGHRFHHPNTLYIESPEQYLKALQTQGFVIPNFSARQVAIENQITKIEKKHGFRVVPNKRLLKEVTGLVEWPVVLVGRFDPTFLTLPPEVLITALETHQKSFAVINDRNQLDAAFIVVSNIESKHPEAVVQGNERVIHARLADAKFFFDNDLKAPLSARGEVIKQVVFQKQLGTLAEKTKRLMKLSSYIAKALDADIEKTKRAAELCKCDLVSEMVYEFPSLQGIMGAYYAKNDKEPAECVEAIETHYFPRFASDDLPPSKVACAVALADKLDTLVGIFGIGQKPTGEKDPFALRRAAIGILRIILENDYALDLHKLIKHAISAYGDKLTQKAVAEDVLHFLSERLKFYYRDQDPKHYAAFEAVLACTSPATLLDFHQRIKALSAFQEKEEALALANANKRVHNILKKQKSKDIAKNVSVSVLELDAEKALHKALQAQSKTVAAQIKKAQYDDALNTLAELKSPIDVFFDQVMVMDKDPKKRANRLALLNALRNHFLQVADIALLPQ